MTQEALHRTELISDSAHAYDRTDFGRLLANQAEVLTQFVAGRLDKRLTARLDAEDIVQDVMLEAVRRFADYAARPAIAFPIWVRGIATDRLIEINRLHIRSRKRSVASEAGREASGGCAACQSLVSRALSTERAPSCCCDGHDLCERINRLMNDRASSDRTLLRLRVIERVPVRAVALLMDLTELAVRVKLFRLLRWLHDCLDDEPPTDGPE